MAHERFRRFNTKGRWPNQAIDYDVSLMVRATRRSVFIAGLTGFDLDGKFHGKDDAAAQADQAMKILKILVEEAGGTLEHVCKVTTYLLDRAHHGPVYNTVARHLPGVAPCGTRLSAAGYNEERINQLQQSVRELARRIEQLQKQDQQLQQQLEKMRASYERRLDWLEKGNVVKAPSVRTRQPKP